MADDLARPADPNNSTANLEPATVQLPQDTLAFLRQAAQKRGVSTGDMVRIALGIQKFLAEAVDAGSKVQIKGKDGTLDVTL